MLKVGLTGGIGAGKSAVSALLAERGAVVIDADKIAREVVEPGTPGLAAVVAEFGEDVLLPSGGLDREKVGRIVFNDPDRLAALNAIVHPLVGERMQELMDAAPDDAVVVYDVPLLVENGLASMYDEVVVVDAPEEVQVERLVEHRGMTEEDARARMANQASREERRAVATHVIDNSGTLDDLKAQVDALWETLTERAAAKKDAAE
ncbi:dephospho-CoA kinase [Actinomadura hallensis]|uniref:Dephospho-CoA kinase n=1 Tax=Actinomadura hallensis TaxID=337895 RepID=A0A543IH51_9ACTN|nr:dephospho-CoA kinase [Actinomadura hallensis]TQM69923.1 dephospho-CoA kinase [Actinomadura hallensis]HLV75141.1 dephospho-CoA kinase [Vulgatibacteraceae bacterium]